MKIQAALFAEYLCNLQPFPVRSRLLHDQAFGARFDLVQRRAVMIGGEIRVNRQDLYNAVRRALMDRQTVPLIDLDGQEILVKIDQDRVFLESSLQGKQSRLDDLMILSPKREERARTLRRLIEHLGPTAPDFSEFLTKGADHELSDDEIDELFTAAASGVAALQARATVAFNTDQATLENLVPDSLAYFERYCGPNPENIGPEEYLRTVLPQYRKGLIRRDLVRGLDICLQGALRDDLMPGAWTEHLNDNELWNALEACDPWCDPFALLGALDITLGRQHDERYQRFAKEAVGKLVQDTFPRPNGLDTYELLPLFAELVLNYINTLESGALRPPFWKRMCAWMHAGFLLRLTQHLSLDLESLRGWVRQNLSMAGMYANLLDLRHEPMYRAAEMSCATLRSEIVGRLVLLRERHKAAGCTIPDSDSIDEAISRLTDQGFPLGWALPGPLDGHRRPAKIGINRLPDDDVRKIVEELATNPAAPVLSHLPYLSQCFDLGEELLSHVRDAIARMTFDNNGSDLTERMELIIHTGLVACAHRDIELADRIVSKIVATAHKVCADYNAARILQALLVAGASFRNEDEWAAWLEEQLAEVASRLPVGEQSQMFAKHLKELKKVLKLELGIHGRAEALALAAK